MGRGILRGAGGDENLKFNFIWPKVSYSPLEKYRYTTLNLYIHHAETHRLLKFLFQILIS